MLQNILSLPTPSTKTVFQTSEAEQEAVPTWAADAAAALSAAGIPLDSAAQADSITRREVANLLYAVAQLIEGETVETFYWAQ